MKKLYSLLIIQLFLCSFTSNLSWGLGTQSTFKAKPSSPNRLTELTSEAKKLGSKVKTSLNKNKKSILGFTFLLTLSCLTLTFFGLSAFIAFGMISLPSYTFYILIVLATIVSIPLILIIVIVSKAYDAMQNKINNSRSSSSSIKIYPQYIFILIISIINILLTLITFIFSILFFNNLLSVAVGATLIGASILMALLLTAFIVYSITIVLISKPRNNTSEFLSKPITQVVSNIIFLSIFTCSVLMIFNIIPIAAPIFSYLPYILLSISVLFYLINIPLLLLKTSELNSNKQQPLEASSDHEEDLLENSWMQEALKFEIHHNLEKGYLDRVGLARYYFGNHKKFSPVLLRTPSLRSHEEATDPRSDHRDLDGIELLSEDSPINNEEGHLRRAKSTTSIRSYRKAVDPRSDHRDLNNPDSLSENTDNYAFSAITAFQSLLFLTTAIIIFTFHTSFATITLPVIFGTFSFILSVLTIAPVILLGVLLYIKTFKFKEVNIESDTLENCFKLIKHNIRALRKTYSRLNANPEFLTQEDQRKIDEEKNKLRKFLKRKQIQRRFTKNLNSLISKLSKDLSNYNEAYQITLKSLITKESNSKKDLNYYEKIKANDIIDYLNKDDKILKILIDTNSLYEDLKSYFDLSQSESPQSIKERFENKLLPDSLNRSA
ncbi:hypothetical protein AB834_03280 [PVC group bacterium (ex Bugula neritina AB1)]|nr:hypothetical protein AB834_03280 [PVC group bacterium (ex Bugula neritina AB1)]